MNANNRTSASIDYLSYGYGLAVLIGGTIGFIKAGFSIIFQIKKK